MFATKCSLCILILIAIKSNEFESVLFFGSSELCWLPALTCYNFLSSYLWNPLNNKRKYVWDSMKMYLFLCLVLLGTTFSVSLAQNLFVKASGSRSDLAASMSRMSLLTVVYKVSLWNKTVRCRLLALVPTFSSRSCRFKKIGQSVLVFTKTILKIFIRHHQLKV